MGDSGDHVRRSWMVENSWKCTSCSADNLGRDLACKTCGSPRERSEDDREADAESAAAVTDEKLLAHARGGANWVCSYCGSQQRTASGRCAQCGAEQKEGKSLAAPARPVAPVAPPASRSWIGILVAVLAGVGGLVGLGVWLFVPREKAVLVSSTTWHYTSQLHRKTLTHGSGWGSPSAAFHVKCERRQDGTQNCNPYTCGTQTESYDCGTYDCNCRKKTTKMQNGFSRVEEVCSTCSKKCTRQVPRTCYHQCPVYRDWCRYDTWEWPVVDTGETRGSDGAVHWPPLDAKGDDERLDKKEEYQVAFTRNTDQWLYQPVTLADFQRFTSGEPWLIKVTIAGDVRPERRK